MTTRKPAKPYRTLNWRDLVIKKDKDFFKPEIVYTFSGGRVFYNNDKKGGPYHNN